MKVRAEKVITDADAEKIVSGLGGTWKGDRGEALCPCHRDRHPSLNIFQNQDGRWTWKCHAGCRWRQIRSALVARGLLKPHHQSSNFRGDEVEADDEEQAEAADAAAEFSRMDPAPADHPYLKKKHIQPGTCRVHQAKPGAVAIPAYDADTNALVSYQFASLKGKRWRAGTNSKGLYHPIGDLNSNGPLVVCESFSTGSSIYEAMGWPVACSFGRGNLLIVAQAMRKRWGQRKIIIAADNDAETEGNPGLTDATKAARAVGALIAVPDQPGDFNDLMAERGRAGVL